MLGKLTIIERQDMFDTEKLVLIDCKYVVLAGDPLTTADVTTANVSDLMC